MGTSRAEIRKCVRDPYKLKELLDRLRSSART
jgi:hypothetical protein